MTYKELLWLRMEFERCAPWIQEALDRDDVGGFELEDVWDYIATKKAQLWSMPKSAIVTVLEFFPRKTVLRYWLCGGEPQECLQECITATDNIESWAKGAGSSLVLIGGRPGWFRALPDYKKSDNIVMTKAI